MQGSRRSRHQIKGTLSGAVSALRKPFTNKGLVVPGRVYENPLCESAMPVCPRTIRTFDVGLKVLTGAEASVDTVTPDGRMFFGLLAVLAEFEQKLIRERTKVRMQAAKRRGSHVGRPRKLSRDQLDMAAQLMAADRSQREVAKALGCAVSTLWKATKVERAER